MRNAALDDEEFPPPGSAPSPSPLGGEGRLRRILDTLDDAVLTVGGGRVADFNRAAAAMLSGGQALLPGTPLADLMPAASAALLDAALGTVREGAAPTFEIEVLGPGGALPVEASIHALRGADPEERNLVVMRPRRAAEAEAALAEHARLISLAHDAILVRELPADAIASWNEGASHMYGWSAEEAIGRIAHELFQTVFPRPLHEILAVLGRTGLWEGELRHRRRNGQEAVVESRWALLESRQGRRVIQIDRDVTTRRSAEIALRLTEQHFRSLFDSSPLGICTVATGGRILSANPALERLLRHPPGGLPGLTLEDVTHPDDISATRDLFERLGRGEPDALALEQRLRRGDGTYFWARLTASMVRGDQGAVRYHMGMVEDIDDRRRAQEAREEAAVRLEELNRAKTAFVSAISHEFRTGLTGVEGFSEILRDEDLSSAEVKELAGEVNHEARRLSRIITDLLELDQLESGRVSLRGGPVDLAGMLRRLTGVARGSAPGLDIRLTLDPAPPVLWADEQRLTRVFRNLLSNAVKYTPEGGLIAVTAEPAGDGVRVRVRDGGGGIPAQTLERMFDAYARLEHGRGERVMGAGLGLAIVRQIVTMHGGSVGAENSGDGGAVFTVELPLHLPEEGDANRLL